ncbi:MAG: hypothetical protein IJ165_05180 [Proteobacteria bacterium]|nr:hypothetical protein [Pseudomonadota bacterium]
MKAITCKGKHAEICRAFADGRRDEAMSLIYGFFRSEENTDSYSVQLLTVIRELAEDGDSEEMYRMRIRMRSSGDKVLINLAQFVWAFETGGFHDAAEALADKCIAELPKLHRSMQDFADEEGLSPATEMAGMRIREAVRILRLYYETQSDEGAMDKCDTLTLDLSRVFLFMRENVMSADMMRAARCADRNGDGDTRDKLCRDVVNAYGAILDRPAGALSPDDRETLECVRDALETLAPSDERCAARLAEARDRFQDLR